MLVSARPWFLSRRGRISLPLVLIGTALVALAGLSVTAEARPVQEAADEEGTITPPADDYIIGPGDALQLFVWKEPDLTTPLTVRIDGKTTVPLLGEVVAAGRTASALADDVAERFKKFLSDPQVTVAVTEASGARFFVVGLVNRPGEYALRRRTSLVQALAMAGGFQEFAKKSELVIVRQTADGDVFLRANYDDLKSGKDPSHNLVLSAGDTILVP